MPKYETTRRVPYTAREMFDVVADVERYPLFVPMCEGLKITSRQTTGRTTTLVATMAIGYKAIRENFTTRVVLHPDAAPERIEVSYLDGPFRHLENRWRFLPREAGGSDVHFYIDYEFRSAMLGLVMGAVFDKAFRKFAEAFEARARSVYGPVQIRSV
ncbi:MAG: type II toxin-antitoxin system RatA family toxin [Hyphomicrobiaceae bacterium]|nr:type II toxin-antitoxin system RatA family toxin [Hyphomicrobiaceae bacterium]